MGGITLGAHVGIQESCEPLKLARTTRSVFQTGSLYTSDEKEEVKQTAKRMRTSKTDKTRVGT